MIEYLDNNVSKFDDEEIRLVCWAINKFTEEDSPLANKEQLSFFSINHTKACLEKAVNSNYLNEESNKVVNSALDKIHLF